MAFNLDYSTNAAVADVSSQQAPALQSLWHQESLAILQLQPKEAPGWDG